MREPGLNLAFQFAAYHCRHGRHFEPSLAEFEEGDALADGADEERNAKDGEYENDECDGAFLFGDLRKSQKSDGHGNYVPENCEQPGSDGVSARLAFYPALRPIGLPEPGFGGMFNLEALLALQQRVSVEGNVDQAAADSGKYQTKKCDDPVLRISVD